MWKTMAASTLGKWTTETVGKEELTVRLGVVSEVMAYE
jgi:hypothetical protein